MTENEMKSIKPCLTSDELMAKRAKERKRERPMMGRATLVIVVVAIILIILTAIFI